MGTFCGILVGVLALMVFAEVGLREWGRRSTIRNFNKRDGP